MWNSAKHLQTCLTAAQFTHLSSPWSLSSSRPLSGHRSQSSSAKEPPPERGSGKRRVAQARASRLAPVGRRRSGATHRKGAGFYKKTPATLRAPWESQRDSRGVRGAAGGFLGARALPVSRPGRRQLRPEFEGNHEGGFPGEGSSPSF